MIPPPKDQWYVVQVLSGLEGRIKNKLEKKIASEEMGDYVYEVLVPTETVSEIKRGKKRETVRKFYPGYIIVNMHLLSNDNKLIEEAWYFIRDTEGVIGFAGGTELPLPMKEKEVKNMLLQISEREDNVRLKVSFTVGQTVKVSEGPFKSQNGIVEEIDPEKGKLRVSVSIFGRPTPVDLEYWQVEST